MIYICPEKKKQLEKNMLLFSRSWQKCTEEEEKINLCLLYMVIPNFHYSFHILPFYVILKKSYTMQKSIH